MLKIKSSKKCERINLDINEEIKKNLNSRVQDNFIDFHSLKLFAFRISKTFSFFAFVVAFFERVPWSISSCKALNTFVEFDHLIFAPSTGLRSAWDFKNVKT